MKVITEKHRKEYDAFGPWIWEIQNNDEIPDLFLKDYVHDSTVELAIKIPRHIERRETNPGADLYDFLVALYPDSLLILKRVDGFVDRREIARCNIVALGHMHDLLHGELHLHLPDETVSIPFSTVSENIIDRIVDLLRASITTDSIQDFADNEEQMEGLSTLFKNLLHKARLDESLIFLAHQKKKRVLWKVIKWYDHILSRLHHHVQESLFLAARNDLVIIQQIPQIVHNYRCYYGYMKTFIPFHSITVVGSTPNLRFEGVETISISAGNREFTAQMEQGFLEEVRRVFDRLMVRGREDA